MPLIIETPNTRIAERQYILSVILDEFLGLPWHWQPADRDDVRITLSDQSGAVILPDVLFSVAEADWLAEASMPLRPLAHWDTLDLVDGINIVDPVVPVLYGSNALHITRTDASTTLPLDIFGSAFFMLSRYEEMVTPDRDEHDRFPAWASVACKEGFLERPIVDEYLEILWAAMRQLWPRLERKRRVFRIKVSHDVDRPVLYGFKSWSRVARMMAGHALKRRDPKAFVSAPYCKVATRRTLCQSDPYNTFNWLMDLSEANDLRSAFYFICGRTDVRRDAEYDPEHPAIRELMRRIHRRGHEIGLHPSYGSYQQPDVIRREAERLRRICAEEDIEQSTWGGRMHYLRWEQPTTLQAWDDAGMSYDSTMSYADRPGFRCGTCFEYSAFNSVTRRPLRLRVRPLIVMECTVISDSYMGLGAGQAAHEKIEELKRSCRKVDGNFTLLWHNSYFHNPELRQLYARIINE